MDEHTFLFAISIVAPDEESAREFLRVTSQMPAGAIEEVFIDEWFAIEHLGTSGEVFGTKSKP